MNDGTGINFDAAAAAVSGGGNITIYNSAPSTVSRSQQMRDIQFEQNLQLDEIMLRKPFRQTQMGEQQQGDSHRGGQNGGSNVGHYQGMSHQSSQSPMMTMNGNNGPSLRPSPQPHQQQYLQQNSPSSASSSFAINSSDNHNSNSYTNFQCQSNNFQPEMIQSPARRGRRRQHHGGNSQVTRSLPPMHNIGGGLLPTNYNNNNNNNNTQQLSQSMTQCQVGQQSLEELRADIHRQTLQLQQLQQQIDNTPNSSASQPTSFFPSQQQHRLPQQQQNGLSRSFTGMPSSDMNMNSSENMMVLNMNMSINTNNNIPMNMNMNMMSPPNDNNVSNISNNNNGGGGTSSTSFRHSNSAPVGMTMAASSTSTTTASQSLFHREDPLGFCQDINNTSTNNNISNNSNINFMNPPHPMNWVQYLQQQQHQMSSPTPLPPPPSTTTAFPPLLQPPLSEIKRRRLNSDQSMLQMFLSDVNVDSGVAAGNNAALLSAESNPNDEPEPLFSITTSPTVANTNSRDLVWFNPDFFHGAQEGNTNTNAVNTNAVPPPPLEGVKMTTQGQAKMMFSRTQLNTSALPPVSNEVTKQQVDKAKDSNKKTKQGTTTTPKDTSNHIITPSTATISELTAEIRSQAMRQKEERASSPSDETQDFSSESNQDKPATTSAVAVTGITKIASVMEASQTSQQNIHDWDRKFGLRRAHSKTMRESCRSRKKVLDFLKGEIKEGKGSVLSTLFANVISSSTSESECPNLRQSDISDATNGVDIFKTEEDEDKSMRSPSPPPSLHVGDEISEDIDMSTTEKVKDDNDDELENMFRRASLDCVESVSPLLQRCQSSDSLSAASESGSSNKSVSNTLMPMLHQHQENDRVQYHARGA